MSAAHEQHPKPTAPYTSPVLRRFGSATELTKTRSMSGLMDGGANNSRSQ